MFWNLIALFLSWRPVRDWIMLKAENRPYLHIKSQDGKEVYMERYWLFNAYLSDGHIPFLPSIRLHYIRRADHDRHLHNHPWDARTFIIRGGYVEEREDERYYHMAGESFPLKHGQFHRIAHVLPDTVTVFVTFKKRGSWGFLVPHREYLDGVAQDD